MIIDGSVTAISWIPSEAITGLAKLPFGAGITRYDDPPPDRLGDAVTTLEALRSADRFRFANHLRAEIELDDDGRITAARYTGGGMIGSTRLAVGRDVVVPAVPLPDRRGEPEHAVDRVRFTQTAGGRTGVPAPRTVRHPPFVQFHAPIAWSTLALTIHADGRVEGELTGASPFPRHWVYGDDGRLVAKTGLIHFERWYRRAFGARTPWGRLDSPALVTEVESALERELSRSLMGGRRTPRVTRAGAGERLVTQGDPGRELFVLLDGIVAIDVDGTELCQLGPGAVMGERGLLEHGRRTATVTAVTPCKVAVVAADEIEPEPLARLAGSHRREDALR